MVRMPFSGMVVGQELPPVRHTVTRRNILRYGKMVGSFNPVHEDEDLAEELGFEGIIAHGVMHLNYITQILCDFAGHPAGVKKIDVRFLKPVYPDDEITARAVIETIEEGGGFSIITCAVWSEKGDGTRVIAGSATLQIAHDVRSYTPRAALH
jgi:acyl dehydratase